MERTIVVSTDRSLFLMLILAVAGIFGALALRPPPIAGKARPEELSKTTFQAVCATCHGNQGEGNRELMAPPIANLPEWYLRAQLEKFRAGLRGAEGRDVHGQQMRAEILKLSEEEIEEALAELKLLPFVASESTMTGDVQAGSVAYREQCMECHRYNGHGELAFRSAPLTGLPDWYLSAQMTKYLEGIRGYHPEDERGMKMRVMASRPVDAAEMADIIAFIQFLSTEYPVRKPGGR